MLFYPGELSYGVIYWVVLPDYGFSFREMNSAGSAPALYDSSFQTFTRGIPIFSIFYFMTRAKPRHNVCLSMIKAWRLNEKLIGRRIDREVSTA